MTVRTVENIAAMVPASAHADILNPRLFVAASRIGRHGHGRQIDVRPKHCDLPNSMLAPRLPAPVSRWLVALRCDDTIPQKAHTFDLNLNGVTDPHELRRLAGETGARRRASEDQVPRDESEPRGQLFDDPRNRKGHVPSVRILLRDSIHERGKTQCMGIRNLIDGHYPWPHREMGVEILALEPLTAMPVELHVANRDISFATVYPNT